MGDIHIIDKKSTKTFVVIAYNLVRALWAILVFTLFAVLSALNPIFLIPAAVGATIVFILGVGPISFSLLVFGLGGYFAGNLKRTIKAVSRVKKSVQGIIAALSAKSDKVSA